MEHEDHEQLADEFEQRADELARENAKLGSEIDRVRKDWDAKRGDPAVPGAVPRDQDLASGANDGEETAGASDAPPGESPADA